MNYKIRDVLLETKKILSEHDIDPREARLLLAYSMGISPDSLALYDECTEKHYVDFMNVIDRRTNGEPYAYIVGEKEFMKLKFKVNEFTLIPREDTEVLVQEAISFIETCKESVNISVLDMCTGSGCIAISLAKYLKNVKVDAVDISSEALKIAKENANRNETEINFIQSDLFEKIEKEYDVIVSNPPYIKSQDIKALQKEVQNEPLIALDGGEDGLEFYKKIISSADDFLKDDGYLFLEIGFDEANSVVEVLNENRFRNIVVKKDLSGNDRVVIAQRR